MEISCSGGKGDYQELKYSREEAMAKALTKIDLDAAQAMSLRLKKSQALQQIREMWGNVQIHLLPSTPVTTVHNSNLIGYIRSATLPTDPHSQWTYGVVWMTTPSGDLVEEDFEEVFASGEELIPLELE